MSSLPAGWYTDPADTTTQRYWDGEGWLGKAIPADATPPDGPPPVEEEPPAAAGHGVAVRRKHAVRPVRGLRQGSDDDAPLATPEGVRERGVGASRQQRAGEDDGAVHRPIMLRGCRAGPARARSTRRGP